MPVDNLNVITSETTSEIEDREKRDLNKSEEDERQWEGVQTTGGADSDSYSQIGATVSTV